MCVSLQRANLGAGRRGNARNSPHEYDEIFLKSTQSLPEISNGVQLTLHPIRERPNLRLKKRLAAVPRKSEMKLKAECFHLIDCPPALVLGIPNIEETEHFRKHSVALFREYSNSGQQTQFSRHFAARKSAGRPEATNHEAR